MKKMNVLLRQFFLLAALALPLVLSTSCSDDDSDNGSENKIEIATLGVEDGVSVVTGQPVLLEAQVSGVQATASYSWTLDGAEVATESSYTFKSDEKGTYVVTLTVTSDGQTAAKSVNIVVTEPSFYVINEGKYGTAGSIRRYAEGNWTQELLTGLGQTSTVGKISGDYMYVVSKDDPVLTKVKLSDLSIESTLNVEDENGDNLLGNNGQGENLCIIDDQTAVLTSSNGAFKVDLGSMTLGDALPGMEGTYLDYFEDIYKAGDNLFILTQKKIKVYDAKTLSYKQDLTATATTGFAQTPDGYLWAANGNQLIKIDVESLETEEITLSDEVVVYYNSSTYTPSGLSASPTENVLYFAQQTGSEWSIYGKNIYKYNADTQETSEFFPAPITDWSVYGAGVQVDPRNGDVYLIYTEDGWGTHYLNTNIYVVDGTTGTQKKLIDYSGEYWFPSTLVFQ